MPGARHRVVTLLIILAVNHVANAESSPSAVWRESDPWAEEGSTDLRASLAPLFSSKHGFTDNWYQGHSGSQARDTNSRVAALQRMWLTPLAMSSHDADELFRSGYKYEVRGRNWKRLAQKLITPGSNVSIVAFGGSLTAGHYKYCEDSSWVEELLQWMKAAFPCVNFTFTNLAHGATVPGIAALCYYQKMPADADLVLVEYSVNGCGVLQCMRVSQPQVAGYEHLLRQVMRKAPQAAIMSFAAFAFRMDGTTPNPYYSTGEDAHGMIARHYGVPMISVRDALYDIIWDDNTSQATIGMTREQMMKDHVHPKLQGAHLYGAGFAAWAIRHLVTKETFQPHPAQHLFVLPAQRHRYHPGHSRRHLYQHGQPSYEGVSADSQSSMSEPSPSLHQQMSEYGAAMAADAQDNSYPSLPSFVSPVAAKELDVDGWCSEGLEFQGLPDSTKGWSFVDEGRASCKHPGCRKYGYMSEKPGSVLRFTIDTSTVLTKDQVINNHDKLGLVILYLTSYYTPMGVAQLSCESGCECQATKLNAKNIDRSSELNTIRVEVTSHPQCVVKILLLNETTTGGHKFRISGVALAPYSDYVPPGPITDILFNSTELLIGEGHEPCKAMSSLQDVCT